MGVRFNASGQAMIANIPDVSYSSVTVTCWAKIDVDRNDYSTLFCLDNGDEEFWVVATEGDGVSLVAYGPGNSTSNVTLTVGKWYFVALTISSGSATLYVRASDATTFATRSATLPSPQTLLDLRLGESLFGEWLNGSLAAVKVWLGTALSAAAVEQEMWQYKPQRTAGLSAFWPLTRAEHTDESGQGLGLAAGAGRFITDGPPIPWKPIKRRVMLPPTLSASVSPSTIAATTTAPAPTVRAGSALHPATVASTSSLPVPSISFGATISLTTIAALAAVPAVSVSAGNVETIALDAVETSADVPAPAISTDITITPAPIVAAVSIPTPGLSGEFNADIALITVVARAAIPLPGLSVPVLPGDLMTGDYQIEYGGTILFGAWPYIILTDTVEGWDDLVELDSGNTLKPREHGATPGSKFGQQRYVSATVLISDETDAFMARVRALRRATRAPRGAAEPDLVIRTRGETLLARGSIAARVLPPNLFHAGFAAVALRWECSDPRRYSLQQYSQIVTVGDPETVTNDGDEDSLPRIRITGPAELPQITNLTLGLTLAFNLQLENGERLDIDCSTGTVRIGSVNYESGLADLTVPVKMWTLAPGDNEILYETESAGLGGIEILWRDAYM